MKVLVFRSEYSEQTMMFNYLEHFNLHKEMELFRCDTGEESYYNPNRFLDYLESKGYISELDCTVMDI